MGLLSSVIVSISKNDEFTIKTSLLGFKKTIFHGLVADVKSMDFVTTQSAGEVYFHARITFKDGQSYELPLSTLELNAPGSFEVLRKRLQLSENYSTLEGRLPRWDRLIIPAMKRA
jgi:hypothetical protein